MKKLVFLVLVAFAMISCGGDKKKKSSEIPEETNVKNDYLIVFQAIYESNDEFVLQYKPADGYMEYDRPITQEITGKSGIQRFTIKIPEGIALSNFQFFISSNKDQKLVEIKNISILNNDKEVYNSGEFLFSKDFDPNVGVTYDEEKQQTKLIYGGQYPPGYSGNEQLEANLDK